MRRIERISPSKLPPETICLSLNQPYWNGEVFAGFPTPYMALVPFFEDHVPNSGEWFTSRRMDARYLIFMKRLPKLQPFHDIIPRNEVVKTFNIRGRVFRSYALEYRITAYVELCRRLGFTEIDNARLLIGLNTGTARHQTIEPIAEKPKKLFARPYQIRHQWERASAPEPEKPSDPATIADIVNLFLLRYQSPIRPFFPPKFR